MKGLATPLSRWLQVLDCLCRYWVTCASSPTGLIPWFSKTEGNTYATLLHHPFLFKGKPTHAQEVARRISGAVVGEIYAQVKTYQLPITNSYPSHYIICHLPLVFLSPTSKTIFKNLCLFFAFFPYVFLFVFPCAFYLLASLFAKNLLIWIHKKCSTWIVFYLFVLVRKPQLV